MNFYQLLDESHTKTTTISIVEEIVGHPDKMDELICIFLTDNIRMSQRAAWPISYIAENKPEIIEQNLDKLLSKLEQPKIHDACIRNIFRALQFINIPIDLEGVVLTKAFEYLNENKSTVAVKVFCMTVLEKLASKYPDIKNELDATISNQLAEGSAAFINRGTKILKKLK